MDGARCIDCDCCEFLMPHMDDGRCLSCHLDFKESIKSTYRPNDRSSMTSSSDDGSTPSSSHDSDHIHRWIADFGRNAKCCFCGLIRAKPFV